MMLRIPSCFQKKISRGLLALFLALNSLANTAFAEAILACNWDSMVLPFDSVNMAQLIDPQITLKSEEYNCNTTETGYRYCLYRDYFNIPNKTYSITATISIRCINVGDQTTAIRYNFEKFSGGQSSKPSNFRNLNMTVSGAGSASVNAIENIQEGTLRTWTDGSLAPCTTYCESILYGRPQYYKTLRFTFTASPIKTKIYPAEGINPYFDNQDQYGGIWVQLNDNKKEMSYSENPLPDLRLCGFVAACSGGGSIGGGGGMPPKPPIQKCTLTIVTPSVVEFQPISTDDLSRKRVRMEDFTLTAIKGPNQSQVCLGSVYNLPGEIKTEGGYPVTSTFWGINHSSGTPQGIGLKLYDLDKSSYLQFNYRYPSFIQNISSMSETKKIRAEIAATTNDLKKIKDGEYSQVLTFEVRMP